jgi:hypothetical protein
MNTCNLAPNHNERMDILRQQLNSRLMWMTRHGNLSRAAHTCILQQLGAVGIALVFGYESAARADHLMFGITPFWAALLLAAGVYLALNKSVSRANNAVREHNSTCPQMTNGYAEAAAAELNREADTAAYDKALAEARSGLGSESEAVRVASAEVIKALESMSPYEFGRRQDDQLQPAN